MPRLHASLHTKEVIPELKRRSVGAVSKWKSPESLYWHAVLILSSFTPSGDVEFEIR